MGAAGAGGRGRRLLGRPASSSLALEEARRPVHPQVVRRAPDQREHHDGGGRERGARSRAALVQAIRLEPDRGNRREHRQREPGLELARVVRGGVERFEQDPHAEPHHHREHDAEDQDQRAIGRARLGRLERRLEHAELLTELPALELRLHDRLVVALREVLERVEQVLVLDLQRVELFGDRGRAVELGLDLVADLREALDLRLRGRAAQRGAARHRLGLLRERVERSPTRRRP